MIEIIPLSDWMAYSAGKIGDLGGVASRMTHTVDIGHIRSHKVHRLNSYWQTKRDGRVMPRREDIDPADLKELLPDLLLGDYEASPFRVRFRLVGTRLAEIHGLDFTGRYLDQLAFGLSDGFDWSDLNRRVFDGKAPLYGKGYRTASEGEGVGFEFGTFPLSDDGLIPNRWVGVEAYEPLNPMTIERLEKTRLA